MKPTHRTSRLVRFDPVPPESGQPAGALLLCDESAILRFASDGVRTLLGRSPDELTGRSVRTLAAEAGLSESVLEGIARTLDAGGSGRFSLVLEAPGAQGRRELEVSVQAMPAREGSGREFVALLADVTARRRAERSLAESEDRYRRLVEASPEPIVVHAGGQIRFINPAGLGLLGARTTVEVIGRSIMDFVHPDYHGIVSERVRKMAETGEPGTLLEEKLLRLDGREIDVEVAGARIVFEGQPAIQLVGRDVTERRRAEAERQRYEQRQQEARRSESLAAVATGVAHQLTALSSAIVDVVDREIEEERTPARPLVTIRATGLRIAALAGKLHAYAGLPKVRTSVVSLSHLLLELSERVEGVIPPGVSLSYDIPGGLPPVTVDVVLMQRMVLDLVRNGVDALCGASGGIQVAARRLELDAAAVGELRPPDALPPGPCVALEVRDDGCGMDRETQRRVLDPFFSTKAAGRGLGLSEVLGLVRAQGGALQIESLPGKGTTVRVLFPVAAEIGSSG